MLDTDPGAVGICQPHIQQSAEVRFSGFSPLVSPEMAAGSALTKHSAFIVLHEAFQQVRKQQARVSNSLAKCRVHTLSQSKFGM